jgi:hypothetical protein
MRLPAPLFRLLDRLVTAERARLDRETRRRITAGDRSLRAWADLARTAHQAGRCVPRCPFVHSSVDTSQS